MKSMTGFGRAAATLPDGTEVNVVVRGVNHRFLDVALKLRDEYAVLEPAIRKAVAAVASRGHVDVLVRTTRLAGLGVKIDTEAAARYAAAWREDSSKRGLPADLSARDLLSLPGVIRADDAAADTDSSFEASLLDLVEKALRDFDETRAREGAALSLAFEEILKRIETGVARLDAERVGVSERIQSSLKERIAKLVAGVAVDEARLAQEVALLADRADITEEIDRLKTHLAELRRLLAAAGPIGRRLDHLAQEIHREVNTSGSKVRETGATRVVLDLKADLETFKEQVQNVE
jgi:uncharacterized protein (TIGR00255 family)